MAPADFEELEVPLPDLAEQQRLVAAHRQARKAAAALEAEATAREQAAITAFEAALGLTPPPDLPRRRAFISRWQDFDRWSAEGVTQIEVMGAHNAPAPHYELIPLEEVAEVAYGLLVSPTSAPDKHPRPYLRVANVQRDHLDLEVIKYIDVPGADLPKTDPEFALEWFNTEAGRFHFLSNAKTTSGLSTLNSQDIKAAPVPVPESKRATKRIGSAASRRPRASPGSGYAAHDGGCGVCGGIVWGGLKI